MPTDVERAVCAMKIAYVTAAKAHKARSVQEGRAPKAKGARRQVKTLSVYQCPVCHHYHLTHSSGSLKPRHKQKAFISESC